MGNKGRSELNLFGGYTHYDSKGHKIGHSDPGLFGGYNHYDAKGHKTGHSDPGAFGSYHHYDSKGYKDGRSDPVLGGYSNSNSDGCYVATCVYGSYDTPEVWTLRRFRDNYLGRRAWGRAFIRAYYAISPTAVMLFGNTGWFRRFWRARLDTLVSKLREDGYSDAPYADTNWRVRNW